VITARSPKVFFTKWTTAPEVVTLHIQSPVYFANQATVTEQATTSSPRQRSHRSVAELICAAGDVTAAEPRADVNR